MGPRQVGPAPATATLRGRYVHPEAHGQPADRRAAAVHGPKRSIHEALPVPGPAVRPDPER